MMLELVAANHPILREPARRGPVTTALVGEMFAALERFGGYGLAAPQVGLPLRFAVVKVDGERFVLNCPVWEPESDEVLTATEGCLSLPGVFVEVPRPTRIKLRRRRGAPVEIIRGFAARVIQHECDHLEGKLITDYLVGAGSRETRGREGEAP